MRARSSSTVERNALNYIGLYTTGLRATGLWPVSHLKFFSLVACARGSRSLPMCLGKVDIMNSPRLEHNRLLPENVGQVWSCFVFSLPL
jgi:hypothetical protein